MEMEWMVPQKISGVVINELGDNIESFKIQVLNENNWVDVATGTTCGANHKILFDEVSTKNCRLYISSASGRVSIAEFGVSGSGL